MFMGLRGEPNLLSPMALVILIAVGLDHRTSNVRPGHRRDASVHVDVSPHDMDAGGACS